MEATPSLSCSNKCVFCWRHGTNPVGHNMALDHRPASSNILTDHGGTLQNQNDKGVPASRPSVLRSMRIRHCALSLVGEPISTRTSTSLSHHAPNRISTFLVCNSQHPAQLTALVPVTQSTSPSMRAIRQLKKMTAHCTATSGSRFCACSNILRERRSDTHRIRLSSSRASTWRMKGAGTQSWCACPPGFVEVNGRHVLRD